jgi:hypothetical protein
LMPTLNLFSSPFFSQTKPSSSAGSWIGKISLA